MEPLLASTFACNSHSSLYPRYLPHTSMHIPDCLSDLLLDVPNSIKTELLNSQVTDGNVSPSFRLIICGMFAYRFTFTDTRQLLRLTFSSLALLQNPARAHMIFCLVYYNLCHCGFAHTHSITFNLSERLLYKIPALPDPDHNRLYFRALPLALPCLLLQRLHSLSLLAPLCVT